MGATGVKEEARPSLELQFADIRTRTPLGTLLTLESEIVELPSPSKIPDARDHDSGMYSFGSGVNQDYYREKATHLAETSLINPVGFSLRSVGPTPAINARLQMGGRKEDSLIIMDKRDYPSEPIYNFSALMAGINPPFTNLSQATYVRIDHHGDSWTLTAQFGTVQPKAVIWSNGVFYIGAKEPCQLNLEAQIYADNLPEPIQVPLIIAIQTKSRQFDLNEILLERDK